MFDNAPASRRAVEAAEQFADGQLTEPELSAAAEAVRPERTSTSSILATLACNSATMCADLKIHPIGEARMVSCEASYACSEIEDYSKSKQVKVERAAQANLLRDIVLYPLTPLSSDARSSLLQHRTVQELAHSIYEARDLPSGNFRQDQMVSLMDELRQIGYDEPEVIRHLQSSHSHVRGCWVIDLILGKRSSS